MKKYALKKDLVIPAGTVFHCIDGRTSRYVSGNYEATIGLSKNASGGVIHEISPTDVECMEWFEEVK